MGLAGHKNKQRIGADPRNLTWSDDSSKFGAKYLQSLGWSAGSGLGATGEGRTSNLKIHQKLDLMGIGANRRGPGGDDAGWRGGREFEGLLARLNQASSEEVQDTPIDEEILDGDRHEQQNAGSRALENKSYQKKKRTEHDNETVDASLDDKRKRKRLAKEDAGDDSKEAKRRRKADKKEKKEQRKAEKSKQVENRQGTDDQGLHVEVTESRIAIADSDAQAAPVKVAPRYRAHRARHLASKRLAAASPTGMNEILGISSSTSSQTSSVPFPALDTPPRECEREGAAGLELARVMNAADGDADQMSAFGGGLGFGSKNVQDNLSGDSLIRKNGKTMAEYFAERLGSKKK